MLLISFLGLAATGLPLKYNHSAWGKNLAAGLGGFSWTGTWYRFFAITTFACLAMYAGLLAWRYSAGRRQGVAWQKVVFGPDSPVPNWRDVRDFFRMVRWFLGLGPEADLRALELLGEVRLLGRLRRHRDHWARRA